MVIRVQSINLKWVSKPLWYSIHGSLRSPRAVVYSATLYLEIREKLKNKFHLQSGNLRENYMPHIRGKNSKFDEPKS